LQTLLDHVADPTGRGSHQHAEWQRFHDIRGQLVSRERLANLGAVSMDDNDTPPIGDQVDHHTERLTSVTKLIVNGDTLAGR